MENEKTMVEMTAEEREQYKAFKLEQEKKKQQKMKKQQREQLQEMTDEVMDEAVEELKKCSQMLKAVKEKVINSFSALMELRKEVNTEAGKKEQDSYMFTNSEGNMKMRIGYNMNDGYLDQVEEGIAKVKAYMASQAKDELSKNLIDAILKLLLARDGKGNLKANKVIQLEQIAEKSGNEDFKEGIKIIRDAYRPTRSKLYVRCSVKEHTDNGEGEWKDIPLGLTEV